MLPPATSTSKLSVISLNTAAHCTLTPLFFTSDFNHDPHSSVFHMDQTKVLDGTMVRILAWYDNVWGFSNRMADTAVAMGKLI